MRQSTIKKEWLDDFRASLRRPLKERWDYSFIHTYKPVMDDASCRVFSTMRDYRAWCENNLPKWLGYAKKL